MKNTEITIGLFAATITIIIFILCYLAYLKVNNVAVKWKNTLTYTYFVSCLFFVVSSFFLYVKFTMTTMFMLLTAIFYLLSYINDRDVHKSNDDKTAAIIFNAKLILILLSIFCMFFLTKKSQVLATNFIGIFKDLVALSTVLDALTFWVKHGLNNLDHLKEKEKEKEKYSFFRKLTFFAFGIGVKK